MCFSSKQATQPISFLIEEVHIIFFFPFAIINILEKIAISQRLQLSALPCDDASESQENSRQSPVFLHTLYDTSNHRIDFIGISITSLPLDSVFAWLMSSHILPLLFVGNRGKEKEDREIILSLFFRFLPFVSPSTNGCYKIKRHG